MSNVISMWSDAYYKMKVLTFSRSNMWMIENYNWSLNLNKTSTENQLRSFLVSKVLKFVLVAKLNFSMYERESVEFSTRVFN